MSGDHPQMIVCRHCGGESPNGSVFCVHCGRTLSRAKAPGGGGAHRERPTVVDFGPPPEGAPAEKAAAEAPRKRSKAVDLGAVARALRVGAPQETPAMGSHGEPSASSAALAAGAPALQPQALSSQTLQSPAIKAAIPRPSVVSRLEEDDGPMMSSNGMEEGTFDDLIPDSLDIEPEGPVSLPEELPEDEDASSSPPAVEAPPALEAEATEAGGPLTADELSPSDEVVVDSEQAPEAEPKGKQQDALPPPTASGAFSFDGLPEEPLGAEPTSPMIRGGDEQLSSLDIEPLDSPTAEAEILATGDFETIDLSPASDLRPLPPPLPKTSRFVLRALSNNLEQSYGISLGDEPITLGRAGADIEIEIDEHISPIHAKLTPDEDGVLVEDLGSLNGVWLRIRGEAQIPPGGVFMVGREIIKARRGQRPAEGKQIEDGTASIRQSPKWATRQIWRLIQQGPDGEPLSMHCVLDEGCRIGRHVGDWVFTQDTYMSGIHAVALPREAHLVLRDLNSRNGTWLRLEGPRRLRLGDAVMMGQTILRLSKPAG